METSPDIVIVDLRQIRVLSIWSTRRPEKRQHRRLHERGARENRDVQRPIRSLPSQKLRKSKMDGAHHRPTIQLNSISLGDH